MKQITPIHLLRTFEAAARHTSFTLAAQELNITQAAISKQIKSLEKELQSPLFTRNAHGVSLTQTGERYWHDIRELLAKIDTVTDQLFDERKSEKIKIRANISYGVEVLAEKIKWFKIHYPDLSIELTHSVWKQESQYDNFDIQIDYRSIDSTEKEYSLLHRDKIFPLVSGKLHKHEFDALPTIHILGYYKEWNGWLDQVFAMPSIHCRLKTWALIKQQEINQNKNIIRVDNSLIAYKLCTQGIGCTLGRSSLAQTYIETGLLKRIHKQGEYQAKEGFHVFLTDTGRAKQACCRFVEFLTS